MMRLHRYGYLVGRSTQLFSVVMSALLSLSVIAEVKAAISYTTIGSNYTQDFDTLPAPPTYATNTSLGSTPNGWTDDNAAPGSGNFSIPGWYLWHTTSATEGGFNGRQRMRVGIGSQNTGAFWSYGVAGTNPVSDRALGNLTSSTIDASFYALRLTNDTGVTLGQFTLNYTAEQWRDGGTANATPSVPQSVTFGYAVTSSAPTNIGALSVTSVASLGFTSPTFGTTTTGLALDGNAAANRLAISATVGGFTWLPGEDLWLRWSDIDHAGNDHGLAIDDLIFSADLPAEVNSVQSGLASVGTTWSDGLPPGNGKGYHVVGGHIVTLDASFPGSKLSVENGSVDINSSGSGQFFQSMVIESGGNLTESVAGDISIGNDATSGLRLNRDVAFNLDANSNFRLKASLTGAGNLDFNETSPGSGNDAQVFLDAANAHTGIIRFNAGKQVNVTESVGLATIEMNSTQSGGNILSLDPKASTAVTRVTFNQPGTLAHAVSTTNLTAGLRLQNITNLVANAPLTVDMSQPFAREERRFLVSGFQGSADITIKGTPMDPTLALNAPDNTTGITLNEFEVGAQGTDPTTTSFEPYSGTISTQDYINVEIRRNMPAAKFVVNENGRLETGAQVVSSNNGTRLGEVVVNSGGTLEVGFEQANAVAGVFTEGHQANFLRLLKTSGKNGSLTLTGGMNPSTLRMQINGTSPNQFDRIEAQGNVQLAGTLNVLVNPSSCTGNDPCGANVNPTWSPVLGETFDIITIIETPPKGDYSLNGTVGPEDYDVWRAAFGNSVTPGTGADGNGNGTIDAADFAIWRDTEGQTSSIQGAVSGTFNTVNVIDPLGYFTGFAFQVNYTSTAVQLQVINSPGTGSAVPEPGSLIALMGISVLLIGGRRFRIAS